MMKTGEVLLVKPGANMSKSLIRTVRFHVFSCEMQGGFFLFGALAVGDHHGSTPKKWQNTFPWDRRPTFSNSPRDDNRLSPAIPIHHSVLCRLPQVLLHRYALAAQLQAPANWRQCQQRAEPVGRWELMGTDGH